MKKDNIMLALNMAVNKLFNLRLEQDVLSVKLFDKCLKDRSEENIELYISAVQLERNIIKGTLEIFDIVEENDTIKSIRESYNKRLADLDKFEDTAKNGVPSLDDKTLEEIIDRLELQDALEQSSERN